MLFATASAVGCPIMWETMASPNATVWPAPRPVMILPLSAANASFLLTTRYVAQGTFSQVSIDSPVGQDPFGPLIDSFESAGFEVTHIEAFKADASPFSTGTVKYYWATSEPMLFGEDETPNTNKGVAPAVGTAAVSAVRSVPQAAKVIKQSLPEYKAVLRAFGPR